MVASRTLDKVVQYKNESYKSYVAGKLYWELQDALSTGETLASIILHLQDELLFNEWLFAILEELTYADVTKTTI